jgi:hypothetical protein
MLNPQPPPVPPSRFIRDGVIYDADGDALPDLAVQEEEDVESCVLLLLHLCRLSQMRKLLPVHLACL